MAEIDANAGLAGAITPAAGEGLYRALFHSSPEGRSLTRASDGMYIDVNAAMLKLLGFSREEVLGSSPLALGVWHVPAEREALVKLLQAQGAAVNFKATLRRRDGTTLSALVSAALTEIEGERYFLSCAVPSPE